MKKTLIIFGLMLMLLIASFGAWAYQHFMVSKPLNAEERALLTPDWSDLYGEDWSPWRTDPEGNQVWDPSGTFNAWIDSMPDEQRAWPLLLRASITNPELFRPYHRLELDTTKEGWRETQRLLELPESERTIQSLIEASQRQYLGRHLFPERVGDQNYDPDRVAIARELGSESVTLARHSWDALPFSQSEGIAMSYTMPAATILLAAAAKASLDNEPQRFTQLIEATDALGRLGCAEQTQISQTIRIAVGRMTREMVNTTLDNDSVAFTSELLDRLDRVLQTQRDFEPEWRAYALWLHDTVRRLVAPDGRFDPSMLSVGRLGEPNSTPDDQLPTDFQRVLYSLNMFSRNDQFPGSDSKDAMTSNQWLRTQRSKMSQTVYQFLLASSIPHAAIPERQYEARDDIDALRQRLNALRQSP